MPTFQTPNAISVDVELGAGDIRIDATDRTDTVVEVLPSDPDRSGDVAAAEQTRVDFADGRLAIRAPRGGRRKWTPRGGGDSVDVRISLPAGSRIRAEAGAAALHGTGALGELRYKTGVGDIDITDAGSVDVRTGAGRITIGHAGGPLTASTGSGEIRISAVDGSAVIRNSNRETWIGDVAGELRVKGANGSISVDRARSAVLAKTANGDIRLGEVATGSVLAHTAFGAIEVGIRDGVAAWLDLDTRFGRVENELDETGEPGDAEETVEVRARTAYGDISIHRSATGEARREIA